MLHLLTVSLILCLVSISGEGWGGKLPPKMRNKFIVSIFHPAISPMVSCLFRENERLEFEIKVYLVYYSVFYLYYTQKFILEATIYRVSSPRCIMLYLSW